MDILILNAIAWQQTAIRRAERRLARANNDNVAADAKRDIERYKANINQLERKAR